MASMTTSSAVHRRRPILPALRASHIIHAHTLLATFTFLSTLLLSLAFHYKLVVRNSIAAWPDEWWPSVSAVIGDWMPERGWFHVGIALCSGPRFALIGVQWLVTRRSRRLRSGSRASHVPPTGGQGSSVRVDADVGGLCREEYLALVGLARTFCCGGWVYVTSTDHHDFHDAAMIAYMLLTLPWMIGTTMTTPDSKSRVGEADDITRNAGVRKWRLRLATAFHLTLAPLIYYFIQHSVRRIPGAYSKYAIFEWMLVGWDVAFDACGAWVEEVRQIKVEIMYAAHDDVSAAADDDFAIQPARPSLYGPDVFELPFELSGWTPIGPPPKKLRALISHLVDVYLAFCFWTIFTSLGPTLFYFSVWKLALSGSELSLLSLLSPYLLAWPSISRWATSRRGQGWLRGIGLGLGLGAFAVPWPAAKVLIIFAANIALWLGLGASLRRLKGGRSAADEGSYLLLGLFCHVALKYCHHSVNPLWAMSAATDRQWNWCGLALAGLCALEKQYRSSAGEPQAPAPVKENASSVPQYRGWRRTAVTMGLGSLLFLLQTLFTDASSIIAWGWTGFPNTAFSYQHAPFVALIALTGLFSTRAPNAYLFGPVALSSACLLIFWDGRLSFVGGAWLLSGLVNHLPEMFAAASAGPTASTFGGAMLLLVVLDVLSVVTVAYAFVPFGQYLRERTDVVMLFAVACLCAGSLAMRRNSTTSNVGRKLSSVSKLATVGCCVAAIALKASLLSSAPNPVPFHPQSGLFTAGIWTVHFGMDEDGLESQRRMLDLISDMQLDVVGLLESDLHRFVYGSRDLTRMMVEELGYYVDIGPGPDKHTWGAALLSKFPIIESRHHLLPSPRGELAPAIHAKLLIHGQVVNVVVAHNGQEEDALDRELQSEAISNITRATDPEPFLSLQYVVTAVGASRPHPYQILTTEGRMWDIEISDYDRWCEYILFRNLWRIGFARVSHGDITDTELQVGKFIVPHVKDYDVAWYSTNEELYYHTPEEGLPESWRFPKQFRGDGVRGHKYHVWDGPLYYAPPPRWWDAHARCVGEQPEAMKVWPCPSTVWSS